MASSRTKAPVRRAPPPLPPRQESSISMVDNDEAPPPYDMIAQEVPANGPWQSEDPRSSSQQSLTPSDSNQQNDRRRLLLVYVHGFMGNETSFQSFPAHVHNLLTVLLSDTHVVHTKIYPRYRSKRNIMFARDDFSKWLEPHEGPTTDVVLLGHSMGGLLIAEVVLMPPPPPASRPLKHRILGTINFDVPYLGMHPGVIKSGLASIFAPGEETPTDKDGNASGGPSSAMQPGSPIARNDTLWGQQDPNYNPTFENDVVLPVRKGWRNAWHFINKHSGDLSTATKQLVSSHMEFGGAMANYSELKARYGRIRALEEDDIMIRKSIASGNVAPARVRFINYYTASTGKAKRPKPQKKPSQGSRAQSNAPLTPSDSQLHEQPSSSSVAGATRMQSPSLTPEKDKSNEASSKTKPREEYFDKEDWEDAAETLTIHEPRPMSDDSDNAAETIAASPLLSPASPLSQTTSLAASLPPIPDIPSAPPPLDISYIQDPATRKLVEKEHVRSMKAYEHAVKDRQKAINDRAKLEAKQEKKGKKTAEKAAKDALKAQQKADLEQAKAATKQRKEPAKELTHAEKEAIRLDQEKQRMEAEARRMRGEPEQPPPSPPPSPPIITPADSASDHNVPDPPLISTPTDPDPAEIDISTHPPPKDRKFCTLPPKDSQGQLDPCWVRVFMKNVDEVGAHCGLFFVDERYERLVGDVAERVEGWVKEST